MGISTASIAAIEECASASYAGTIDFGTVVKNLAQAGVESYHADYRSDEITYYFPSDETYTVKVAPGASAIAVAFHAGGVSDAVRGAQRGEVRYPEFVSLTRMAGCVGYMVWIAGRHVQYQGRRGEMHVEHFPS